MKQLQLIYLNMDLAILRRLGCGDLIAYEILQRLHGARVRLTRTVEEKAGYNFARNVIFNSNLDHFFIKFEQWSV